MRPLPQGVLWASHLLSVCLKILSFACTKVGLNYSMITVMLEYINIQVYFNYIHIKCIGESYGNKRAIWFSYLALLDVHYAQEAACSIYNTWGYIIEKSYRNHMLIWFSVAWHEVVLVQDVANSVPRLSGSGKG